MLNANKFEKDFYQFLEDAPICIKVPIYILSLAALGIMITSFVLVVSTVKDLDHSSYIYASAIILLIYDAIVFSYSLVKACYKDLNVPIFAFILDLLFIFEFIESCVIFGNYQYILSNDDLKNGYILKLTHNTISMILFIARIIYWLVNYSSLQ